MCCPPSGRQCGLRRQQGAAMPFARPGGAGPRRDRALRPSCQGCTAARRTLTRRQLLLDGPGAVRRRCANVRVGSAAAYRRAEHRGDRGGLEADRRLRPNGTRGRGRCQAGGGDQAYEHLQPEAAAPLPVHPPPRTRHDQRCGRRRERLRASTSRRALHGAASTERGHARAGCTRPRGLRGAVPPARCGCRRQASPGRGQVSHVRAQ
mmetsp:Transcript_14050/g.36348  ORF Transcript_14050/g.36348 Transcript_14050/m.36348 type:complete len:207 (-) Transcript_14050:949-1569(-)